MQTHMLQYGKPDAEAAGKSAVETRRDEEMKQDASKVPFYPQEGVAVTCRSFAEYEAMFGLTEALVAAGTILDVAAGASSFTAEANARGFAAVAADPRYAKPAETLFAESAEEIGVSTGKLTKLQDRFDWTYYGDLDKHRAGREASLTRFIEHYRKVAGSGTYVAATLPNLPFEDGTFALALCSHFLFLYEDQFAPAFHVAAVKELYRVVKPGGEVRLYPLMNLRHEPYSHMDDVVRALEAEGAKVEMRPSRLPFLPGSTQLLRIAKPD